MEQLFNVAKRERKSDVHHHRQPDNFGRRVELAKWFHGHAVEANIRAGASQPVLVRQYPIDVRLKSENDSNRFCIPRPNLKLATDYVDVLIGPDPAIEYVDPVDCRM